MYQWLRMNLIYRLQCIAKLEKKQTKRLFVSIICDENFEEDSHLKYIYLLLIFFYNV